MAEKEIEPCKHKWVYQGLRYRAAEDYRGGTLYSYYDVYFCEKCLERKTIPLNIEIYGLRWDAKPMEIPRER